MQEFNSLDSQPALGATAPLDFGAIASAALVGTILFAGIATLYQIPAAREIWDRPDVRKPVLDLFVSLLRRDGISA